MNKPTFNEEKKLWKWGFKCIAGVDEVGRGAWAGPIVASAVVWPWPLKLKIKNEKLKIVEGSGIDDSKKLKPRQREKLAEFIKENALGWGIGEVGPRTINKIGMAKVTKMAFRSAIADLKVNLQKHNPSARVDFLLIDAFYIPYVRGLRRKHQKAIIDGDQKSLSIAAASIIAKVYRDKLMQSLSRQSKYKKYKWGKNKGYGTKDHQAAIKKFGITQLHRRMFVETWKAKISKF